MKSMFPFEDLTLTILQRHQEGFIQKIYQRLQRANNIKMKLHHSLYHNGEDLDSED